MPNYRTVQRKFFSTLLIPLLLILKTSAQTRFETDFQLWNDTQVMFPLNQQKDLNAMVWIFGRFGNKVRTTTDARIGVVITKKLNSRITLGTGYLYRYSNPSFRKELYESRYLGILTLSFPLGKKLTLINRNLYQYEDRYLRPNTSVIRNRFWFKRQISPESDLFVSFEPFYDFRLERFARYRTQIGFSHKFSKRFSADFYYVRQDETGNRKRPGTLNAIGSSLRVNF